MVRKKSGTKFGAWICPYTHTIKMKTHYGTKTYKAMIADRGDFHGRVLRKKFNGRTKAIRYREEVMRRWEKQERLREKSAVDRIAPGAKVSTASQRMSLEKLSE